MATIIEEIKTHESISAFGTARSTVKGAPLSPEELNSIDAYWRASLLPVSGHVVPQGKPAAARTAEGGAHKAATAGPLGFGRGSGLHVHPLQPADQQVRPERHFYIGARPRRAGCPVAGVSRG